LAADFEKTKNIRRLLTVIWGRRNDDQSPRPPIERLQEPGLLRVKTGDTMVSFRVDMSDMTVTCRGVLPDGTRTSLEHTR